MNNNALKILEYKLIIEELSNYAISEITKERIIKLMPSTDIIKIENNLLETTEARKIVDISSSIPLHSLEGIKDIIHKIEIGGVLNPEELVKIKGLLKDGRKLKRFMKDKDYVAPNVSMYSLSISELKEIEEEIDRCIDRNRVIDGASNSLMKIRRKKYSLEDKIKEKLERLIKSAKYKGKIQDNLITTRNGRYVIPIKAEYKKEIEGTIHDKSSKGNTVFLEPAPIKKLHNELNILEIEEEQESFRILAELSNLVVSYIKEIKMNMDTMLEYDFLLAKGKYSKVLDGMSVKVNEKAYIKIVKGKHPLLGKDAVPLDFEIGKDYNSLVITGPNTGGKTVSLKTVGLLTMMVQTGLHVPVKEGSEFAIYVDILADIGDGQSIQQSLSTFSSHIKNIINILKCADKYSLVIIDELGAGTDPGEGAGLAMAVLEELHRKKATILVTSHYNKVKDFALQKDGFENGCMEFDINSLKPLYKLSIGKSGDSNAFLISLRLGMNKEIIERAHEITYKDKRIYNEFKEVNKEKEIRIHKEKVYEYKKNKERRRKYEQGKIESEFKIGDCVYINTMERTGIVYEEEDSKGEIGVIVMKEKYHINKKRLSIYIEAKELYPEEYDMNIVTKSKDYRKKDKLLSKRHIEGLVIEEE